ncbi:MAG: phosphatase PAP2 family protein, partial [Clostridia bacterium]|nr:phosphatase PAP2 family protein [Clostridia bacterium]
KKGDVSIYYWINKKFHCTFLDVFMRGITHLGSTIFAIVFPLLFLVFSKQEIKNIGMDLMVTMIISQFIVHSIKRVVRRPRPYRTLKDARAVNPPSCQYSFPSGHTCTAFSFVLPLMYHIPMMTPIFLMIGVLVALSRIYLGFHYPTDVFIGFFIAYMGTIIQFSFF